MSTKTNYTWVYIDAACESLADIISSQVDIKYVVGVARGGLIPATLIAKYLGVREVLSIGLKSYNDGDDYTSRVPEPHVYQDLASSCPQIWRGDPVLIVDDISDKGNTLQYIDDNLTKQGAINLHTAVIFSKPGTSYEPTYTYSSVPDDEWVLFPWEKQLSCAY